MLFWGFILTPADFWEDLEFSILSYIRFFRVFTLKSSMFLSRMKLRSVFILTPADFYAYAGAQQHPIRLKRKRFLRYMQPRQGNGNGNNNCWKNKWVFSTKKTKREPQKYRGFNGTSIQPRLR